LSMVVSTSLHYQLQKHLLCLFEAQRKGSSLVIDMFSNLKWKLLQNPLFVDLSRPPVPLLRWQLDLVKNTDVVT
jgi:hypothetical protein